MADTIANYTGNGTQTDFVVPFDYLKKSFVHVYVDKVPLVGGDQGDEDAEYFFVDNTTIRIKVAPAEGTEVTLRRITPADDRIVSFEDGSILKATDLDTSQLQAFHIAEEARDQSAILVGEKLDTFNDLAQDAADSAQEAQESAETCKDIRQEIERYSWDIPHLVDTLKDVEDYEFDGYFAVGGFGDAGEEGEDISNRYVKADGSTKLRTLGERFADVVNVRDFGAVGDGETDDTSVFQKIEESVPKSTYVNLLGLTFYVTSLPFGAKYFNGVFKYNGNLYIAEYSYLRNGSFFFAAGQGAANSLNPYAYRSDITAIGRQAGYHITDARNCIAIGEGALFSTTGGRHNIAIGNESLYSLTSTSTGSDMTGTRNTAIGGNAGHFVSTGNHNIIVGRDSGHSLTTGIKNVIIGNGTLMGDCPNSLDPSVVINQTPSNATSCVVMGTNASKYLNGVGCVAIGENSLLNLKDTTGIIAIGYDAGKALNSDISPFGTAQTEVNLQGTYSQSGSKNITITTTEAHGLSQGFKVRLRFTSGELGDITFQDDIWFDVTSVSSTTVFTISTNQIYTATGSVVIDLISNSTTSENSVADTLLIGYIAGRDTVSSTRFTAIGSRSGTKGGNYTTYVGALSGNLSTGSGNTAVGASTLAKASGSGNTAVGQNSGQNISTGSSNVLIGRNAGVNLTTGETNVAVGSAALNLDISGANFNYSDCVGLGSSTRVSGNHQVQLGNSDQTPYAYAALQLRSDKRDKTDIRDTQLGSSFILSLRPVDFKWDLRDDYIEEIEDGLDDNGETKYKVVRKTKDGSKKRTRYHHGFIAQEVKELLDNQGIDFGGYQDHTINGGQDVYSLGYEEFIAPIVKTIQELSKRIEALEKRGIFI